VRVRFFVLTMLLAAPTLAAEGASETFLGLPRVLWYATNLVAFLGLLVYLLAKPLSRFFRSRRHEITHGLEEATSQKLEAERLRSEVASRVASLESEISALRERLRRDGERERDALEKLGEQELARLLAQVDAEASRRVEETRTRLASEAAGIAAELALELLEKELTGADRERIFSRTLERLRGIPPGGAT